MPALALVALAAMSPLNLAIAVRSPVRALAFSPSGTQLAAATESGSLSVFEVPKDVKEIRQTDIALESVPLRCLAFSDDGSRIACGGGESRIGVYSAKPRLSRIWSGQVLHGDASGVDFCPDGESVAWTSAPTEHAYIYGARNGALLQTLSLSGNGMETLRYLPDGKTLVTGGQALTIWDLTQPGDPTVDREPLGAKPIFTEILGWTKSIDVDGAGRKIAACGAAYPEDQGEARSVVLVDGLTGKLVRTLARSGVNTHAVAISRDGRYVVAGDAKGEVRVWRTSNGALWYRIPISTGEIWAVAINPRRKLAAVAGDDGTIRLFNFVSGQVLAEF